MTWEIFVGLTVVIGFIITVSKPVFQIAKTLATLNLNFINLKETITNIVTENTESHKKLWDSLDNAFEKIDDHEKRLVQAETELKFLNIDRTKKHE